MGHIATQSEPRLRIWTEGSRVDVPAGENRNPFQSLPELGNPVPRGVIADFSDKSRRRLQRELATRRREAEAYTMALTLPGDFSHLPPDLVIARFRVLQRRFIRRWSALLISLDWKRELQARMALHYHLILYGLEDPHTRVAVRSWFVAQWNSLCCEGLSNEASEHHRWFHSRDENFEQVRDMAGYFAKYVGKHEDSMGALPGRWWGSWNKDSLPVSPVVEITLTAKANAMIRRIANKLRRNRMNDGKHRQICHKIGVGDHISRWTLQRFRMGYSRQGYRAHGFMTSPNSYSPAGKEIAAYFDDAAKLQGLRFGKSSFRGKHPSSAPIILLGKYSPNSMMRAVEWVCLSLGIPAQLHAEATRHSHQTRPLTPPPGYVRRPRRVPPPVQLDLIPMERIRPCDLGFNQIADGGKGCPSRGRIGGRLS